ncbi:MULTISPECIES: hypothetical protein [unclassified Pseudonocardia]|uniref:hypothetical protein n=1 Tax=unclassified Pseudonocardia TaxID=2619320 RepID=UPI0005253EA4|nr:hypothetical protein [Pseudonocardia sp. Ae707_Ps1]OLM15796.1 putative DNA-binding protein [Pseudonocardia sp. Ae707_Ps1]
MRGEQGVAQIRVLGEQGREAGEVSVHPPERAAPGGGVITPSDQVMGPELPVRPGVGSPLVTGRREHLRFARGLRETGATPAATARQLRERFGVRALTAARLAHGWSQSDAAAEWNRHWPDAPRTFKAFSYWENWPGPTGHAPSLDVLERLARLYVCAVRDLLADLPDHGDAGGPDVDRAALVWQVQHLDLPELVESVSGWAAGIPAEQRRAWLLKLSTAAAAAAPPGATATARPALSPVTDLRGAWASSYSYPSTSRGRDLESDHLVDIECRDGRLVGTSRPDGTGSELVLTLDTEGVLVTGTWHERTSPTGHYRAASYHGTVQLVLDPTGTALTGRWLGISKQYTIKSGEWRLRRTGHSSSTGPETSSTTVSPANRPSPIDVTNPSSALPT